MANVLQVQKVQTFRFPLQFTKRFVDNFSRVNRKLSLQSEPTKLRLEYNNFFEFSRQIAMVIFVLYQILTVIIENPQKIRETKASQISVWYLFCSQKNSSKRSVIIQIEKKIVAMKSEVDQIQENHRHRPIPRHKSRLTRFFSALKR